MKSLTISFTDKAYATFKSAVMVRQMTGNAHGAIDDVANYILFSIEHDIKEKIFKDKEEALNDK